MDKQETIVAIIYDFDKTLCDKDMQEYSFIPNLGINPDDFWKETNKFINNEKIDKILGCMYMLLKKSKENNVFVTKEYLRSLGVDVNFFPGVTSWFERINDYASKLGLKIEHYIISSGLREIIKGTSISKYFKEIYACEFLYDEKGEAIWPKLSVNYTTKVQFITRINKGVLDISNDNELNKKMLDEERRISTKNMIYLGDGFTDIPSMRMIKENGGYSIAVYQNNDKEVAQNLLSDNRIDFYTKASYEENSEIERLIKNILTEIAIKTNLKNFHNAQLSEVERNKI